MEDGFKLLSGKYLEKTNLEEWTNRFTITIKAPGRRLKKAGFIK